MAASVPAPPTQAKKNDRSQAHRHAPTAHRKHGAHHSVKPAAPRPKWTPAPTPAAPHDPSHGDGTDHEEDVEEIDVGTPTTAASAEAPEPATAVDNRPHGLVEWISRLHAAMVHLPIAWTMLLCLGDTLGMILGVAAVIPATEALLGLALLSFAPAVLTGLLRYQHLPHDPQGDALVHRNIMYVCVVLIICAVGVRLWQRRRLAQSRWRYAYWALVVAATVAVTAGAHLGGALVYGDDFLPFLS